MNILLAATVLAASGGISQRAEAQAATWQATGALPSGITSSSAPAVASWGTNRLDSFVLGTDSGLVTRMYHQWATDGVTFSAYEVFSNPPGVQPDSDPAVVSWGANRLDVFVRGTDSALWHKWYDSGVWGAWESLGGVLYTKAAPAVSSWGNGRLDVFLRGSDRRLYHAWYAANTWSGFEQLGTNLLDSDPAAVSSNLNRIDVFVNIGNNLYQKSYNASMWGAWTLRADQVKGGPAVSSWGLNRLDVFSRRFAAGFDNGVYHIWTGNGGTTFSAWEPLGGVTLLDPEAYSLRGTGRIDVVVSGGQVYHAWFAGNTWLH